uniref:Putative secreted protein n=1 Tax=Anopheles darlingi TaxID=43151 RepID=A0A2M4DEI6_ANODA
MLPLILWDRSARKRGYRVICLLRPVLMVPVRASLPVQARICSRVRRSSAAGCMMRLRLCWQRMKVVR